MKRTHLANLLLYASLGLALCWCSPASGLTILTFTPDTGTVTGGVLEVAPSAVVEFTATIIEVEQDQELFGYELNFENSHPDLVLSDWVTDPAFPAALDPTLDTSSDDDSVSFADLSDMVPAPVDLGAFTLTAPSVAGDFLLTVQPVDPNDPGSGETLLLGGVGGGDEIVVDDYGDLTIRVVPEPAGFALVAIGALALAVFVIFRRRALRAARV